MTQPTHYFVVFEGIDGSGKTTLVNSLYNHYLSSHISVLKTNEPTLGTYGRQIREYANLSVHKEFELFLKDRKEHVDFFILPSLSSGSLILCDRYYISSMAYQSARGLDWKEVQIANELFAPLPDLIIYLRIEPELAFERLKSRKNLDRFESLENLKNVHNQYEVIFECEFKNITKVVDASENFDKVVEEVLKLI